MSATATRGVGASGGALLASGAAGTVLAVLAVRDDGVRGALSVWLGVAVVAAFFLASAVPLLVVRGQEERRAAAGAGILLLTYTLRLVAAVAVLRVASRSDAVDPRWTGLAVVLCALVWVVAQAVVSLRTTPGTATAAEADPRAGGPAADDLPGHGPEEGDR